MPAYPNTLPAGNQLPTVNVLSAAWPLRKRLARTWTGNANHVSGSHSKRRCGLEGRYERCEKVRLNLVNALERELVRDPESDELKAWRRDLAYLTPDAVGAIVDPAAKGPGGGKRRAFYLPDVALPFASLMIRLAKKVMKALRYQGRQRVLDHMRQTLAILGRSLARPEPPHSAPPQTLEEKPEVRIYSEPTALKGELLAYIAKVQAMQPAAYVPDAGSEGASGQEAR